jgi:hypothetical protein
MIPKAFSSGLQLDDAWAVLALDGIQEGMIRLRDR